MRVVLDTNVLISGLMGSRTVGNRIWKLWRHRKFVLLTSEAQLEELRAVTRYPAVRKLIVPRAAGARINLMRLDAEFVSHKVLPGISQDPDDDFLFTIAKYGKADYLVSADKIGVRDKRKFGTPKIVVPARFLAMLDQRFKLAKPVWP